MKSTRRRTKLQQDEAVPAVFREMLSGEKADEDARPLKKRKTAYSQRTEPSSAHSQSARTPDDSALDSLSSITSRTTHSQVPSHARAQQSSTNGASTDDQNPVHRRVVQTIIDSDESDDSDMEWEDALGGSDNSEGEDDELKPAPLVGDISIAIGDKKPEEKKSTRAPRRRAITSVEKKRRLDVHKMHILCLLYHVHRRNVWCNDRRVQSTLRKVVPPKTLLNLVPDPTITQYSASKRFVDGMNELKIMWSKRFKITAQGMYKPRWAEVDAGVRPFSDFDDLDDPMDKDEFRNAAYILQGSQDVGTQLFCALLRGIGVETRLVCSLQPLPFASAAERATPQKPSLQKNTIVIDPFKKSTDVSPSKPRAHAPPRHKKLSRLERIMGERHAVLNKTGVAPKKQKAYHTPFPVYWVEAFNSAHQKWVPIDTHSTFTVDAPDKLEPALSFTQNSLTYAIAFDEDYTAKDVTRRYARSYNAKTRKFRVECTPNGDRWWRHTLKFFQRSGTLDRDQVEDAALARKEAAEGMPKNVQDFKGHPFFVLERHLRHNEVIYPPTQVGKVNCGSAMNPKMEPIYRRSNVHIVRSSDKWYRMGRDIKERQQPLKRAKPKKGRDLSVDPAMGMDEEQEDTGTGLYAEFQTELYIPPPVIRGRVPRNAYGNLDLYVPSMCPTGGTHVRHKLASKAARIVGVDFADAVTGFSFKGRHGTAIVQGVVVAHEFADAVQAVIDGMEYQQEEAEAEARRSESLRLWRRFFLGLRIAQRVNAIEIDGEKGPTIDVQEEISRQDRELAAKEMAGGFFPDEGDSTDPGRSYRGYEPAYQNDRAGDGGFIPDEDDDNDEGDGGFMLEEADDSNSNAISLNRQHSFESSILDSQQLLPRRKSSFGEAYSSSEENDNDMMSGGFLRDTPPNEAGPFVNPQHSTNTSLPTTDVSNGPEPFLCEHPPTEGKQLPNERNMNTPDQPDLENTDEKLDILDEKFDEKQSLSSSPSDAVSLPLEDPEDEDADPDWLVDAT